jgi:RimJ/RimL family protein N-acetyltransferase
LSLSNKILNTLGKSLETFFIKNQVFFNINSYCRTNLDKTKVFVFTYVVLYIVSLIFFAYLIDNFNYALLYLLFNKYLESTLIFLLSIIILILGFYLKSFEEMFDLFYKLINNSFKLLVIFVHVLVLGYFIFEPSLDQIYYLYLWLINLRFIFFILLIVLAIFTNKNNMFNIVLTISLGIFFSQIFFLLGLITYYSVYLSEQNGKLDNYFDEYIKEESKMEIKFLIDNLNKSKLKENNNQNMWKFNLNFDNQKSIITNRYNITDILLKFELFDRIINRYTDKYSGDCFYNQKKFMGFSANKYTTFNFLKPSKFGDIYLKLYPEIYTPLPESTINEILFLSDPSEISLPKQTNTERNLLSKFYKRFNFVLTTRPCVDNFNDIIIKTDRLIIRAPFISDLDKFHILENDKKTMELYHSSVSENIDETRQRLMRNTDLKLDNRNYFVAFIKNLDGTEGNLIGKMYIHTDRVESYIGYALRSDYWGKGYGTELVKSLINYYWSFPRKFHFIHAYVFNTKISNNFLFVKRESLSANVSMDNYASQHLLQKLGFNTTTESVSLGIGAGWYYLVSYKN